MKLATIIEEGRERAVAVHGDRGIDLRTAIGASSVTVSERPGISLARAIMGTGAEVRREIDAVAADLAAKEGSGVSLALATFAPPIPDPTQIFCLGLNYAAHVEESGMAKPPIPEFFVKLPGSLVGHGHPIRLPLASEQIDYEGELVAVVGRTVKDIDVTEAASAVAGVTIMNDVSARDLQLQGSQWLPGKILDTFGPCGPFVVTDEDVNWAAGLALETRLNGDVMQQADTATMLTSIPEAIAYLSMLVTLHPGDLIATGTPAGVGFTRRPPVYLRDGDDVEVDIEGLGTLRNPVAAPAV